MALAVAECLDWSAGLPRSKLKRVACLEKKGSSTRKNYCEHRQRFTSRIYGETLAQTRTLDE